MKTPPGIFTSVISTTTFAPYTVGTYDGFSYGLFTGCTTHMTRYKYAKHRTMRLQKFDDHVNYDARHKSMLIATMRGTEGQTPWSSLPTQS
jgi:hypothetical protein